MDMAELPSKMYAALMLSSPDWAEIFAPKGRILQEGEFIQRKNLAWTLSVIAANGADGFYKVRQNHTAPATAVY